MLLNTRSQAETPRDRARAGVPHRSMRSAPIVTAVAAALVTTVGASAAIHHVDGTAAPGGGGASWSNAHRFLVDALAVVQPGDEVHVAQGEFRPDRSNAAPRGTGDRMATFALPGGVVLRGGYGGLGAANPDAQDPWGTPTVLSGDLLGDDAAGGSNMENSAHVVTVVGDGALLFGCHVVGGHANLPTPTSPTAVGGGLYSAGHPTSIEQCRFAGNAATGGAAVYVREAAWAIVRDSLLEYNVADGDHGGAIRVFMVPSLEVIGCEFRENVAEAGGAIAFRPVPNGTTGLLTVSNSTFFDNLSAGPGGAIHTTLGIVMELRDTLFAGNGSATSGAGAVLASTNPSTFVRCAFLDNDSQVGAGGLFLVGSTSNGPDHLASCLIAGNWTAFFGGGVYAPEPSQFMNCLVAQNAAVAGAGIMCEDPSAFAHCTVADNFPDGIKMVGSTGLTVVHSIFSSNGDAELAGDPAQATIDRSLIAGGWSGPGVGNIDGDPLFVAVDARDYRLDGQSPALDAGDAALVPTEIVDLDGDMILGPLTVDALGASRIQGAAPDLGAFEGAATARIPQDAVEGLPPGETTVLSPESDTPWAGAAVAAAVSNIADEPASFTLAEIGWSIHREAAGFTEEGLVAALETVAPGGTHFTHVRIPIGLAQAPDQIAAVLRPTIFDPATNAWRLAVGSNTAASPGHTGAIGDLFVQYGDIQQPPSLSDELGDHGVFWDAIDRVGFVWANVDVAGEFGVGRNVCPADIAPGDGDGLVDGVDLGSVLAGWGAAGSADITLDGIVDAADLAALLADWGGCGGERDGSDGGVAGGGEKDAVHGKASPVARRGLRSSDRKECAVDCADLDRDGMVDGGDLGLLLALWGDARDGFGAAGDLNGDGQVDGADLGLLLAGWTR